MRLDQKLLLGLRAPAVPGVREVRRGRARKAIASLAGGAMLATAALIATAPPAQAADGDVVVHLDQERQEIEGFILSGAFRQADNLLNNFTPEVQDKLLELVFSKEKGIGLSIWRNMAPDQTTIGDYQWSTYGFWFDGPAPTFKTAANPTTVPSTVDANGVSNFDGDNYRWFFDSTQYPREGGAKSMSSDQEFLEWGFPGSPVDRGQVWVMKRAQDIAAEEGTDIKFVTAVWSPPVWMKTAGSTTYNGSVPAENYQQFAEYCADLRRATPRRSTDPAVQPVDLE
ncbi:MAG: hypothetical protein KIT69_00105 [Propionibacteriaceae bacterium]|nr:hypothetical protein [Propionibacteriaceae bacterium]